jgi:hypothetical protein
MVCRGSQTRFSELTAAAAPCAEHLTLGFSKSADSLDRRLICLRIESDDRSGDRADGLECLDGEFAIVIVCGVTLLRF